MASRKVQDTVPGQEPRDVEGGLYDSSMHSLAPTPSLDERGKKTPEPVYASSPASPFSPFSPRDEAITLSARVPVPSLSPATITLPQAALKATVITALSEKASGSRSRTEAKTSKQAIGRWTLFRLWFNTYRKFFTLATLLNATAITLAAAGRFPYAEEHLGAVVLGNLLCAILVRNELFLRILYTLSIYSLRQWAPLSLKLATTSILQHLGGIHSGCAVSGAAWLIFKIVNIVRHRAVHPDSVVATGIVTTVFVLISILSAFPWVRNNYHNTFERYHRFVGWLGLATTWSFVILSNSFESKSGEWRVDAHTLVGAQEFWFVIFMTVFVLVPWLTLRRVPVEVEIPSSKAAILRFDRGMQQGLLGRISRTSTWEYHAFGIISNGRKARYHYMVCGVQGDFTRGLVNDPPKFVWTRELKFAGVGHVSAMFKRGIRVCTGTGIGAALSTCIQNRDWFLIWIGSDQEKTFGKTVMSLIHDNIEPERRILWDTRKRGGRPDTMQLIKNTWESFSAEVVFITSNLAGNNELMQGCREAGIHAFGTLWDF